ncbi:MAG: hypothetical protein ABI776_11350 [Nocardioidaceae bacterium]
MVASHLHFVDVVVADRDLVVTRGDDHACRLEPRASDLAWYCDLDDGTPTDSERDPASFVRWVCPAMRGGQPGDGTAVPLLDVRRPGPHSDLGRLLQGFGRLAGRASGRTPGGDGRFVYTDPAGILDVALRRRIESWPSAEHGDGVVRPAELWSIKVTGEGLVVESVSWWDSAPALDHQIGLAVDIARRLTDPQ